MNQYVFPHLRLAIAHALHELKCFGYVSNTQSWQGIKNEFLMWEYDNLYFRAQMPKTKEKLQEQVLATQPWAEDHFNERRSGKPLNPGEQYKNWPYYKNASYNDANFRKENLFTHTYMERYWPKYAGHSQPEVSKNEGTENEGIRYAYGDLEDVINLLGRDPHTRQAYLPVWFPEDTGAVHGGRVPCSIGYHFIMRNNQLNIHYTLRACDALRHFRNDIYLTVRLAQWVLHNLFTYKDWGEVELGVLTMDVINFHVFEKEKNLI